MAGFNTLIWNTKDSARAELPPIEKADEKHKRDLSRSGGSRLVWEAVEMPAKPRSFVPLGITISWRHYTCEGVSREAIHSFMECEAPQSMHLV